MAECLEVVNSLIEPAYHQTHPNRPIRLDKLDLHYKCEDVLYKAKAEIRLRFLPRADLEIRIPTTEDNLFFAIGSAATSRWDGNVYFPSTGIAIPVFCTRSGTSGVVFSPTREPVEALPSCSCITYAKCHIFNMPDFSGADDYVVTKMSTNGVSMMRCGRVTLQAGGWVVTIAATEETKKIVDALRESGGYAITHVAKISRTDATQFTSGNLTELLCAIHFFLSFTLGRWVGVGLPVAFNNTDQCVWKQWGLPITDRDLRHSGLSWFDPHHATSMAEVFPGFWKLWQDVSWRKPLKEVIYWYLRANAGGQGAGVDTGLILAQAAMELLAWTYCVQVKQVVSTAAFSKAGLKAADKFRLLVSLLNIPKDIPLQCKALQHQPGRPYKDIMEAITTVRNTLVHPDASCSVSSEQYFETWNISTWILEMCILRLCGFTGKYSNRLKLGRSVGDVDPVPWA